MHVPLRLSLPASLLLMLIPSVGFAHGAQIVHHDLEARIDPRQRSITVTDVLTVALGSHHTRQPFGFFLNRNLMLAEVSAIDRELPWTLQAIPSPRAVRDSFPAIDPAQLPDYAMATYYQLLPRGLDERGNETLMLRLVDRGVIVDPLAPPAFPHARGFAHTTRSGSGGPARRSSPWRP
jgi:hypothetical protein